MSLLLSDSLIGVIDEKSLNDEGFDFLGKIDINGASYIIDAFVTDRKSIRVHAEGKPEDAIGLLNLKEGMEAKLVLGDDSFVAKGRILQVGWENLPTGGRLVISMSVRDK